jgi:polar amino acid transport system substrate-binding protein
MASCSPDRAETPGGADDAAVIAISIEPPFMELGADGTPAGVGPELDWAILKDLGITTLSVEVMEFGAMIPALQARRVNMVSAGGLNITPERCRSVAFSEPVLCGGDALIFPRKLGDGITSYADVAASRLKVAACAGCTQQKQLVAAGVAPERIVNFIDGPAAMALLASQRVDLVVIDAIAGDRLFEQLADPVVLQLVPVTDGLRNCSGAAFRPADHKLLEDYNRGLRELKQDGRYLQILREHDMEDSAVNDQTPSTAQICQG